MWWVTESGLYKKLRAFLTLELSKLAHNRTHVKMFFLRRRASTIAAPQQQADKDTFEVEMPIERRRSSVHVSLDGNKFVVEEILEETTPNGTMRRHRRKSSINLDELHLTANKVVDEIVDQVLREASAGERALQALDGIMDDLDLENDEMATSIQRKTLVEFILQRDNKFEYADRFVQMFKLYDCAHAVQEKYGALPNGWDLEKIPLPRSRETITTQTDYRINEILDSEHRFVSTIIELQTAYLDRLYEVFGSGNKDDIQKLGLTQEETNQIFEQLPAICRFSQQLLQKLEPISMVRTQPVTGEGRAVHVGLAFRDMAHKLHVYAPAITSYQQTLQILTTKTQKLADQQAKKRHHQQQGNFVQLWEQVTKDNPVLRGQQLNAVLITPMQRIPRYKMLLEQLVRDCEDVEVIQEALELFTSAARNINEAVRSHEKLVGFFGAGSELKPMSSTGGATKHGEVKIVNSYTHKLVS